jgi:RNA polymerase sigma factor (sigma-70 family)
MTDRELLAAYQRQRSAEHFAELVARHVDLAYSVARRLTRDAHLAEDDTQEVFLTLARKAGELNAETPLAGWLFKSARLLSLQMLRERARRSRREMEAAVSHGPTPGEDPMWTLIAEDIDRAVADLAPADRDALLLRYFSGKSHGEIAGVLAISEEAAKKRVQRGLEALQTLLTTRGMGAGSALTALALGAVLSAHAVQAAPSALASSITTAVATKAAGMTLSTKGTLMVAKLKASLIASAAVIAAIAVTATAVTAIRFSGGSVPVAAEVPVAADAATQAHGQEAAAGWKGWGVGAYPAVSPFEAVRWKGDAAEVQVKGMWYQLLGVNDVAAEHIVASAKSADREWQRRFEEDFVALLAYMGHEPGATVTLKAKNLETQKEVTLSDVAMTENNRRAIYVARHPAATTREGVEGRGL